MTVKRATTTPPHRNFGSRRSWRQTSLHRPAWAIEPPAAAATTVPAALSVVSPVAVAVSSGASSRSGSSSSSRAVGESGALVKADPRVEGRVEHVHHQVEEDVDEDEERRDAHDERALLR